MLLLLLLLLLVLLKLLELEKLLVTLPLCWVSNWWRRLILLLRFACGLLSLEFSAIAPFMSSLIAEIAFAAKVTTTATATTAAITTATATATATTTTTSPVIFGKAVLPVTHALVMASHIAVCTFLLLLLARLLLHLALLLLPLRRLEFGSDK